MFLELLGVLVVLGFFGILETKSVLAIYDPSSVPNNKFGIHILETTEIEKAAELVNSTGGQWGYTTIPIRANERDLDKWTKFMEDCGRLRIIPILRIASFPVGDHWMAPNEYDLVDFANFLDELPWPTKNRYVVVYNEPNHQGEWGGFVDPAEYARVLDRATDIFHKRNADFFVISAGLDASAPSSANSLRAYDYEWAMNQAWPGVFERVDGLSFHAYGNPGFASYPNVASRVNVASYRFELGWLGSLGGLGDITKKPIFLTEAGWVGGGWLTYAFENVWTDDNIVAITPFVLSAQDGPFAEFSFTRNNEFLPFAKEIMSLPKTAGNPQLAERPKSVTMPAKWNGNLPQMLSPGLIGSWLAKLLAMLTRH